MATSIFTFLRPNSKKSRQNPLPSEVVHSALLLCNSQLVWDNLGPSIISAFVITEALLGHTLNALKNERQLLVLKILLASLVSVQWEFCGQCCKAPEVLEPNTICQFVFICLSRLTATCSILRTPGLQEHTYPSPCHSTQQRAATPATCTRQSHYFHEVPTWQLQGQSHQELRWMHWGQGEAMRLLKVLFKKKSSLQKCE